MISRPQMLWFGRAPTVDDRGEAKNRQLSVHPVQAGDAVLFRHATAAVFWGTTPDLRATLAALEEHLVAALNEGLFVHVVVSSNAAHEEVQAVIDKLVRKDSPTRNHLLVRIGSDGAYEAPELAARHPAGPFANDALEIIKAEDVELEPEQLFILRRAFSDCRTIVLREIPGGKSGAMTFIVEATLSASHAGPKPTPFFAKMDKPHKLMDELRRFERFAEHHIPWFLRPNFRPERCIYCVREGVLVGSFVEPSDSLWNVARTHAGPQAIQSLFEVTLAAWRRDAHTSGLEQSESVVSELRYFCNHTSVPPKRVQAARDFGDVMEPRDLWLALLDLPPERWRKSAMHGDMHGENVRVRNADAIVIDFAHATNGPMSADLASLDVWLAFQVPPSDVPPRDAWRRQVECLYSAQALDVKGKVSLGPAGDNWLEPCIATIRAIAGKVCHGSEEYKSVIAVYLLRHASFPADPKCREEDEFRRAVAYWLASRLVASLGAADVVERESA